MPAPELNNSPKNFSSFLKHLRIFKALAQASIQADMEYRANFVSRIVTDIVWYAAQVLTFETLYLHTSQIGGWTAPQMRVFLGLLFVVDAIYMVLFSDNMDRFSEKIRKGDLDLLLMKPVNSQMMISLQRIATALLGNLLIALIWLVWALSQLPDLQPWRLLLLVVYIPVGVLIFYCFRFLIATTAVIFTRADSLQYMWHQFYKLGCRPDSLYAPWLKYALLTVMPVLAIVAVPAHAIVNEPQPLILVYVLLLSLFMLWGSGRFWRYALSKYTSASS